MRLSATRSRGSVGNDLSLRAPRFNPPGNSRERDLPLASILWARHRSQLRGAAAGFGLGLGYDQQSSPKEKNPGNGGFLHSAARSEEVSRIPWTSRNLFRLKAKPCLLPLERAKVPTDDLSRDGADDPTRTARWFLR